MLTMETTTKVVCNTALIWSNDDVENNIGYVFPEYEDDYRLADYFQEIMENVIEENADEIMSRINDMIRYYLNENEDTIRRKIELIIKDKI